MTLLLRAFGGPLAALFGLIACSGASQESPAPPAGEARITTPAGTAEPPTAEPAIHALVIGINDYGGNADLRGAVNDAKLMTMLMRDLGAEQVITLIDRQATREAILAGWNTILESSREGDLLVVTYAGHGAQVKERVEGSEPDKQDEYFKLGGFDHDPAQVIVDDEWGQMFDGARGRRVFFLADACHSGTLYRSPAQREHAAVTRSSLGGNPLFPNGLPKIPPESLPHVISFAAVDDLYMVPEIRVDGSYHGALTVAFDLAVRGAGDLDGDGSISAPELLEAVRSRAKLITDGGSAPVLRIPRTLAREQRLFRSLPARPLPDSSRTVAIVDPVTPAPDTAGLAIVQGHRADFIWSQQRGTLVRTAEGNGTVVAEDVWTADDVQGEIRRWAIRSRLAELPAAGLELAMTVNPFDAASPACDRTGEPCRSGDYLDIDPSGSVAGYSTLLSLMPKGRFALLAGPQEGPIDSSCSCVKAPYGIEHVVLLSTSSKPDLKLDPDADYGVGALNNENLAELERLVLAEDSRADWLPLYTKRGPGQCLPAHDDSRCPR